MKRLLSLRIAQRSFVTVAVLGILTLLGGQVAQAGQHDHGSGAKAHHSKNLVETAKSAGSFNTLLTAAKAAGLADTLAEGGPFTVFAPTDEAFAALPEGTLQSLLDNPEQLKKVLLLHVVEGRVPADKALNLDLAPTLYGQPIYISTRDGGAYVDDARITQTDVKASNGVIHVIDKVLLPKDIVGIVTRDARFSTLATAVKTAGLVDALQGEGPLTVFAPTNAAFEKLPSGTVPSLLEPDNRKKLTSILTYHVASGAVTSDQVVNLEAVTTLQGSKARISVKRSYGNTTVMIDEAKVILTDVKASNGVVHVIDTVLMP